MYTFTLKDHVRKTDWTIESAEYNVMEGKKLVAVAHSSTLKQQTGGKVTSLEWCNKLEPKGIAPGAALKWRFYFLSLLRTLRQVDDKTAARAAHLAARTAGLYDDRGAK